MERERNTQLDRIDLGVASVLQRASLALYAILLLIAAGAAADLLLEPPMAVRSALLGALAAILIAFFLILRGTRRAFERERRVSRERTQSFFDLSLDMLCTIGRDDRLAELNPSWTRVLGFEAGELRSAPAIEFVHPDDRARTIEISAEAMAAGDEGTVLENRWRTHDGEWRWLSWSLRPGHDDIQLYGRATDITERKLVEQELAFLVRHDELTGLSNRRKFEEDLEAHLNHTRRYGWRGALLAVDLDGLKAINDERGHAAGDALLRLAAQRMDAVLRSDDVLARLGADEFAVLLPEADHLNARAVAQKLVEALAAGTQEGVPPVASIGVATIEGQIDSEELFARADRALYAAKRASGGTFRLAPERAAGPAPSRSGELGERAPLRRATSA